MASAHIAAQANGSCKDCRAHSGVRSDIGHLDETTDALWDSMRCKLSARAFYWIGTILVTIFVSVAGVLYARQDQLQEQQGSLLLELRTNTQEIRASQMLLREAIKVFQGRENERPR